MSAFLTKISVWLAEKLGLKFFQRLWKKIRKQPETKVKLPSGLEVTFKGEEAPGVYIDDGIRRFLAMPIRTPSGLAEVVEAKQLMESGETAKAEEKIRELLSEPAPAVEAPTEEEAFLAALRLLDEGDRKFDADDFAGAEKAYGEAGEMAAKSGNELLQSLCGTVLGAAVGRQGRHEEVLPLFEKALALNPDDAEAWFNKGTALDGLERADEAIPCYDEAIRLKPDFAEAWFNKGTALALLDRYEDAIPCFNEAIRLNPRDAATWHNKGVTLLLLDQDKEAKHSFEKAVGLRVQLKDKGAQAFRALTFLILIERKEDKEIALELIQLRKEAKQDNVAHVVDSAIAEFKTWLSKKSLKQFRKFEKMLWELEKS
jgi:tetratricopeptide (TPR) repeat protein